VARRPVTYPFCTIAQLLASGEFATNWLRGLDNLLPTPPLRCSRLGSLSFEVSLLQRRAGETSHRRYRNAKCKGCKIRYILYALNGMFSKTIESSIDSIDWFFSANHWPNILFFQPIFGIL